MVISTQNTGINFTITSEELDYIITYKSIIYSSMYSHRVFRKNPSNINIFLIKNLPYANTRYIFNDPFSNHLPIMLNLENINVIKKDAIIIKTKLI